MQHVRVGGVVVVAFAMVLGACGGSPPPPAAAPAATVTFATNEELATAFLVAVARRDREAVEPMLLGVELCAKAPDVDTARTCTEEMESSNDLGLSVYWQHVPEEFAPGEIEVYPIDADQGIYMINVTPAAGGDPIAVLIMELEGHRYVIFPRKA